MSLDDAPYVAGLEDTRIRRILPLISISTDHLGAPRLIKGCCGRPVRVRWRDIVWMLMSTLIEILKRLFLPRVELSRVERTIFDSVVKMLPPREAEIWAKQLAVVNKIHRSPDGKEINLFSMRRGKSDFPDELCFNLREPFKIAVVDLSAGKCRLRGRVWCVNGHVFSIEYKTSWKNFDKEAVGDLTVHCHLETSPVAG